MWRSLAYMKVFFRFFDGIIGWIFGVLWKEMIQRFRGLIIDGCEGDINISLGCIDGIRIDLRWNVKNLANFYKTLNAKFKKIQISAETALKLLKKFPLNALEDNKSINLSMRRCQFFLHAIKNKIDTIFCTSPSVHDFSSPSHDYCDEITFVRSTMTFIIIIYYYSIWIDLMKWQNVCVFAVFSVPLTKKNVCLYISARLHSQLYSSCSTLNGRSRLFFLQSTIKKYKRFRMNLRRWATALPKKYIYIQSKYTQFAVPVCMNKNFLFW